MGVVALVWIVIVGVTGFVITFVLGLALLTLLVRRLRGADDPIDVGIEILDDQPNDRPAAVTSIELRRRTYDDSSAHDDKNNDDDAQRAS